MIKPTKPNMIKPQHDQSQLDKTIGNLDAAPRFAIPTQIRILPALIRVLPVLNLDYIYLLATG